MQGLIIAGARTLSCSKGNAPSDFAQQMCLLKTGQTFQCDFEQ